MTSVRKLLLVLCDGVMSCALHFGGGGGPPSFGCLRWWGGGSRESPVCTVHYVMWLRFSNFLGGVSSEEGPVSGALWTENHGVFVSDCCVEVRRMQLMERGDSSLRGALTYNRFFSRTFVCACLRDRALLMHISCCFPLTSSKVASKRMAVGLHICSWVF